jgi:hypothetical protein
MSNNPHGLDYGLSEIVDDSELRSTGSHQPAQYLENDKKWSDRYPDEGRTGYLEEKEDEMNMHYDMDEVFDESLYRNVRPSGESDQVVSEDKHVKFVSVESISRRDTALTSSSNSGSIDRAYKRVEVTEVLNKLDPWEPRSSLTQEYINADDKDNIKGESKLSMPQHNKNNRRNNSSSDVKFDGTTNDQQRRANRVVQEGNLESDESNSWNSSDNNRADEGGSDEDSLYDSELEMIDELLRTHAPKHRSIHPPTDRSRRK